MDMDNLMGGWCKVTLTALINNVDWVGRRLYPAIRARHGGESKMAA